jgi:hypothetical protein
MDGKGTLILMGGNKYVGLLKQAKFHGFGRIIYSDGHSYQGKSFIVQNNY